MVEFKQTVTGYRIVYDSTGDPFVGGAGANLRYPVGIEEVAGCKLESPDGGTVTPCRDEAKSVLQDLMQQRRAKLEAALKGLDDAGRANG